MSIENSEIPTTLGLRMRMRRQEKGWTQEQLALRAGTNQAVIQKIENGKSLRPRKIDQIAAVLEVNPAWLMFGEKPTPTVSNEALQVAQAWEQLTEPDKSRLRQEIMHLA
ncbi:MAG: helix-turn-helix domain-containing protein [Chromatiales bacterium]|nr:helix-turn-helix domain-containing protein [Chromatiales bacterium]